MFTRALLAALLALTAASFTHAAPPPPSMARRGTAWRRSRASILPTNLPAACWRRC